MIKQISLEHKGGSYFYSVNNDKLDNISRFDQLKKYLYDVFNNCPHHYFNSGPRGSTLRFDSGLEIRKVIGHEISSLAKQGLQDDSFNSNHLKVQMFLLKHDPKTIAMEVPIWLKHNEFDGFKDLFKDNEPLTGHIDLIRIEDNKVWIWDYKPRSDKERYASTQLLFYAFMLSKRTGISLEEFRCGYFDDKHAFLFKPEMKKFEKNYRLTEFS